MAPGSDKHGGRELSARSRNDSASNSTKLPQIVSNNRSPYEDDPRPASRLSTTDSVKLDKLNKDRPKSKRQDRDRPMSQRHERSRSRSAKRRSEKRHSDSKSPRNVDPENGKSKGREENTVLKKDGAAGKGNKTKVKNEGDADSSEGNKCSKNDSNNIYQGRRDTRKLSTDSDKSKRSSSRQSGKTLSRSTSNGSQTSKNSPSEPSSRRTSQSSTVTRPSTTKSNDKSTGRNSRGTSVTSESRNDDDTVSRDERKDKQAKRREQREVRSLSKTVERKLTYIVNVSQRENSFSPQGVCATTRKMLPYEVEYKLREVEMDRAARRKEKRQNKNNNSKENKEKDSGQIQVSLRETPQQVALKSQVTRMSVFANDVFSSVPVSQLNMIHRYRPYSSKRSPEQGDVQNYNCHIGSALSAHNYVDYYIKQGLQTGSKEKSSRLQKLPQKKDKDNESEEKHKDKTETKNDKKKEKKRRKGGAKSANDDRRPRNVGQQDLHSDTEDTLSSTDETDDDVSYNDDNNSDVTISPRDQRSRASERSCDSILSHQRSQSRSSSHNSQSEIDRTSNYNYSSDFDPEQSSMKEQTSDTVSTKDQPADSVSTKDPPADSVSVHTYMSTEHAVNRKISSDRPGQDIEY